jgi:uncharacterized protein (PEP-CTERM system associated)
MCRHSLLAAVLGGLLPGTVLAANWRLVPFLELGETYTDNVTLQTGAAAESDFVTEVNPGFSISGRGRELELSLGYRMQNLFYAQDSARNDINHQLDATAHGTLVPQLLFLDAKASLSQQVLTPTDSVALGNIASIGNREDVFTTHISPNLRSRLGNVAIVTARYTQDRILYSGSTATDSVTDSANLQLTNTRNSASWTWVADFSNQNINYSRTQPDERRKNASLTVGYRLSYQLQLTALAGYEDNQYETSVITEKPQGEYWNAGLVWSPSPRTNLTIGTGRRYFGRTKNMSMSYRGRRNAWHLSYLDDLSSRRQLQFELQPVVDANGVPVIDLTTQQQLFQGVVVASDEVFIRRRGELEWDVHSRKATLHAGMYVEKREYQQSNEEEHLGGGNLSWDWRISRHNNANIGWGRQSSSFTTTSDAYRFLNAGLTHSLGRNSTSSIEFRRTNHETRGIGNEYVENLVIGRLHLTW